ncbi:TonB-dependent siderophore receptor [uncultured Sphingomonas sp.]|uniref:TonB-dependent receptor plug domain-containing protein n=1 Tax=uncultured Sphingomonas sp. TaxID=158754 RepID=UPI0025EB2057|nr:TonB-dependent receptor [uncultured Sphingomonas sp.]
MKKSAFLGACSLVAYFAATGPVVAQQTQTPNQAESQTGVVPVPQNSDAADEEKARKNAEQAEAPAAKAGDAEARAAEKELRRYQTPVIHKTKGSDDVLVTGSRLRDGDKTSRLIVIDAKEIQDRGVTSVEDLIRTLPQNVATIGTVTNNRGKGPLATNTGAGGQQIVSPVGALGVSAANLGGVGAGNTLILINGRRIAGAAGFEAGFANLNGIPLSAIERVEISTGGQSAIYGADAMGGVINFILKKNYVGTTISATRKQTSSGADDTRISLYTGRAWGSGNVAASVEFGRVNPIVNARTGYVTNNYAPYFGGNSAYDKRTFSAGTQPGTVVLPGYYDSATNTFVQTGLTVPKGFTGAPKRSDLIATDLSSSRDYVPEFAGPRTRTVSGTLNFDQKITDRLRVFATGLYTWSQNIQQNAAFGGLKVNLAPGQYYNPFRAFEFGQFNYATSVYYFPQSEISDGTLSPGDIRNTVRNWNVNGGVSYDFGKAAKLQLMYTKSKSSASGTGTQLGSLVDFQANPASPTGYSCYNFMLANNRVPANQVAAYKAAFDRQCLALTSSDPNVAFNPWKSTTNGGGASVAQFLYPYVAEDLGSSLDNIEARLNGEILRLPAGSVSYAVGAEYARNSVNSTYIANIAGNDPTTDRKAFFGEINLPILGRGYDLPLVKQLLFNIALRRDITSSTGPIGTVGKVPVDQGGQIIYGKNEFGRTTPAWGVLWSPTPTINVRARFTRGFKAPPATQLYALTGTQTYLTTISNDPLYTCTTDCVRGRPGVYTATAYNAPNPNLRPETSRQQVYSITWQPNGFLSGLNLAATYNRNRIRNQFATISDLGYYLPSAQILQLPQFYQRNAAGKITQVNNMRYNIIGSNYESMTYEASYLFSTGIGTFQPKIVYVDNMTAETTGLTDAQKIDQRGRILGVDRYKIVGSLQWNYSTVSTNIFVYHTPSYINDYAGYYAAGIQQAPKLITPVAPLTTVDASVSWVVNNRLNLQLVGRNIFKAAAPFTVVDNLPYDTARYNIEGRSVVMTARLTF